LASELDHDEIKKKIVAILKANTSLYTTTGEAGELRAISVGFPQGTYAATSLSDAMLPYAYVTNSTGPFETVKSVGAVVSNAILVLEHTFNYDIVVVVLEKDARAAEILLDEFQKLILQTLEADHSLTGTTTAIVDSSYPSRIDRLRVGTGDEGKGIKGRVITIKCMKVTG
jgi:hypothetical protein